MILRLPFFLWTKEKASPPNPLSEGRGGVLGTVRLSNTVCLSN